MCNAFLEVTKRTSFPLLMVDHLRINLPFHLRYSSFSLHTFFLCLAHSPYYLHSSLLFLAPVKNETKSKFAFKYMLKILMDMTMRFSNIFQNT